MMRSDRDDGFRKSSTHPTGYWEHTLRDDDDVARHIDYIHFNPVKHGHVARVADWPHSSFHRMVARGNYPLDWAGDMDAPSDAFGERS